MQKQPHNNEFTKPYIRALFEPKTFNEDERSVQITIATDTPVKRYSWRDDEYFNEILDIAGVNMERATNGLPLLDNHSSYSTDSVLGRVFDIQVKGKKLVGRAVFSKDETANKVFQKVKEGIITDVSVGYSIESIERMEKPKEKDSRKVYVRSWTPMEVSFVVIPADPKAGVRENTTDYPIFDFMEDKEKTESRGENQSENKTDNMEAIKLERARISQIRSKLTGLSIPENEINSHIEEGLSVAESALRALDYLEKNKPKPTPATAKIGIESTEYERNFASKGLVLRAGKLDTSKISHDERREIEKFRNFTLLELASYCLERSGVVTLGMNKFELAKRAITSNTADFPIILSGAYNNVMLGSYATASRTWSSFCGIGSVSDFRENGRIRTTSFGSLDELQENGELKNKVIPDGTKEKVRVKTRGNIINLSREMIINDDLGGFLDTASRLGMSAGLTTEKLVYALLAENSFLGPIMNDGKTLYHVDHGNIATAGAPSVSAFEGMRVLMKSQKDDSQNEFLDIEPKIGLFPASIGGQARVIVGSPFDQDVAGKFQKPNMVQNLLNTIVDTARLQGTRYYMFADPATYPAIQVNFLNGVQNPIMEQEESFDQLGIRWRIFYDVGANAIDHRATVTNAGA